jgi:hypothetical protein
MAHQMIAAVRHQACVGAGLALMFLDGQLNRPAVNRIHRNTSSVIGTHPAGAGTREAPPSDATTG